MSLVWQTHYGAFNSPPMLISLALLKEFNDTDYCCSKNLIWTFSCFVMMCDVMLCYGVHDTGWQLWIRAHLEKCPREGWQIQILAQWCPKWQLINTKPILSVRSKSLCKIFNIKLPCFKFHLKLQRHYHDLWRPELWCFKCFKNKSLYYFGNKSISSNCFGLNVKM